VVGLVVVVARVVSERRQELAIRVALGATTSGLAWARARDVMAAPLTGIGIGCQRRIHASVELMEFMFEVEPRWPAAYGAGYAIGFCTTALAAWLPAWFPRVSRLTERQTGSKPSHHEARRIDR
jgi:hypothetical protein